MSHKLKEEKLDEIKPKDNLPVSMKRDMDVTEVPMFSFVQWVRTLCHRARFGKGQISPCDDKDEMRD